MRIFLSEDEFKRRRSRVREELVERNLQGRCLFSPTQIFYLTGFSFIPTERPMSLVYSLDKEEVTLFVPLLEREHAEGSLDLRGFGTLTLL